MVTTDENIVEEMEEYLDLVQEDELQPVYDDVIQNQSQELAITSPIGPTQSMPKKQSKHFNYG